MKLSLAEMPDSYVFSKLGKVVDRVEFITSSVHGIIDKETAEEYQTLKAEALRRLSNN